MKAETPNLILLKLGVWIVVILTTVQIAVLAVTALLRDWRAYAFLIAASAISYIATHDNRRRREHRHAGERVPHDVSTPRRNDAPLGR